MTAPSIEVRTVQDAQQRAITCGREDVLASFRRSITRLRSWGENGLADELLKHMADTTATFDNALEELKR